MPKRLWFRTIVFAGAALMGITALLFLTAVSRPTGVQYAALVSLLLSQGLAAAALALAVRRPLTSAFAGIGLYVSVALYSAAAWATALLFMLRLGTSGAWLTTLQLVWLVLWLGALALVRAASATLGRSGAARETRAATLSRLTGRLDAILARHPDAPWRAEAAAVADDIRFGNPAGAMDEARLEDGLTGLEAALLPADEDASGVEETGRVRAALANLRAAVRENTEAGQPNKGGW